ncbi:FAD/NAD(P)-binding domain-containing protein [Myriangium duriaei CBS 260.36]|uniref:FAD/NAD(P)-binding domain-containing protein n=1 Tax=Myriangium duriaei CBS 260.36 TaxID=1168546 RepID=A0A9P4MLT9_9PEZI|nr:FAD/NAD(P)-binding domain-containing protein [Myriangium duriaei CBS 260.36]
MAPINGSMPVGSYPPLDIDVIVVGTGLAGLTAALECIRKGMRVRVLERNATINTAGDMFFLGLSATKLFRHWPDMESEYERISLHNAYIETFKHDGTPMIKPMRVADRLRDSGLDPNTPPGTFQMRPLVYKMYVEQVERLGVDITYSARVVEYFEENDRAGVITDSGERYTADLVIAADGVGSKSQAIVGGQIKARSSNRAMWRAAFPVSHLKQNPEVERFFGMHDGNPIVRTFLAPNSYALTLSRPDTMIWIVNHDATGSESENWNATIDYDEVIDKMNEEQVQRQWANIFKDLVRCTPPGTIVNFPLHWRDPKPTWTSPACRIVQIGDSAHSFLPASGNGATQAIEDAVTLASCLQIGGKQNIAQSVRAHVRFRFIRNACAQKLGFFNSELLQSTDWDKVKLDPRRAAPKLPKWIWSHDPESYAYENYDKVIESMKQGIKMEDEENVPPNYPPGYKYEPWSIDDIMADMQAGRPVELGGGNWD